MHQLSFWPPLLSHLGLVSQAYFRETVQKPSKRFDWHYIDLKNPHKYGFQKRTIDISY